MSNDVLQEGWLREAITPMSTAFTKGIDKAATAGDMLNGCAQSPIGKFLIGLGPFFEKFFSVDFTQSMRAQEIALRYYVSNQEFVLDDAIQARLTATGSGPGSLKLLTPAQVQDVMVSWILEGLQELEAYSLRVDNPATAAYIKENAPSVASAVMIAAAQGKITPSDIANTVQAAQEASRFGIKPTVFK